MITECGYTVVSAAIQCRERRDVIQRILRSKFRAKKTALRRFFWWFKTLFQYQLVIDSGVRLAFVLAYFVSANHHVMNLIRSICNPQCSLPGVHSC